MRYVYLLHIWDEMGKDVGYYHIDAQSDDLARRQAMDVIIAALGTKFSKGYAGARLERTTWHQQIPTRYKSIGLITRSESHIFYWRNKHDSPKIRIKNDGNLARRA